MKANSGKCHFICSTNDTVNLIVENQLIDNSKCEKLLGVKLDYKSTLMLTLMTFAKNQG